MKLLLIINTNCPFKVAIMEMREQAQKIENSAITITVNVRNAVIMIGDILRMPLKRASNAI